MRAAVLDDYERVALQVADWSPVLGRVDVDVFSEHVDDEDELARRLAPYDIVVLMRERTPMPASLLERLPSLRLLVSTGRKNASVDVGAARDRGITACGTDSPSSAPAELTWALVLGLARNLVVEAERMRRGGWQSSLGADLAGRTLGVIGLGRIGAQVTAVGKAFGMDVLAWSANLTAEAAERAGARAVPLDRLLADADVVTVHLVLSRRTRGLLGARELALMKPTAFLVNTSRAPIVDTTALLSALEEGRIGGAGLDVFDEEPLAAGHPLTSLSNAVLTPHIASAGRLTRARMAGLAADNLLAMAAGRRPPNPVVWEGQVVG
jgi:phosphoglycerate dehydrogenase-like enzyme